MTPNRAILLIVALTAYRILLLVFDRTDLFVDEAQYWMWSRELAFGYFSKPPMIAWVIHLTTALGGSDSRFWIRLSSPLVHGATAGIVMAFAKAITGSPRIAAWSGASFATLPGVALSSVFVSTDTVLLFFYALAALAALAATRTGLGHAAETHADGTGFGPAFGLTLAIALGLAIGLGLLSKYAMLYFPATALLAALALPRARMPWQHAAVAGLVAVVVVLPNLGWNAQHGGATFRHTSDNIGWSGLHLHVGHAMEFFGAQFGVVGPIIFSAMIAALVVILRGRAGPSERQLAMLSWPIIGLLVLQALMSRAYANWAATAYVAGVVLAVSYLETHWRKGLTVSLAVNGTVALALPLLCAFPQTHLPGHAPILNRYLGRSALSLSLAARARAEGLTTIMADNRDILADLVYTLRDSGLAIRARPTGNAPRNTYEQDRAYDPSRDAQRILLVTGTAFSCPDGASDAPGKPPVEQPRELDPIQPANGYIANHKLRIYAIDARCLKP